MGHGKMECVCGRIAKGGFQHSYPLPKDIKKMNAEQWLAAMGWSKIHTMQLNGVAPKVLKLLSGPVLPSLKCI